LGKPQTCILKVGVYPNFDNTKFDKGF